MVINCLKKLFVCYMNVSSFTSVGSSGQGVADSAGLSESNHLFECQTSWSNRTHYIPNALPDKYQCCLWQVSKSNSILTVHYNTAILKYWENLCRCLSHGAQKQSLCTSIEPQILAQYGPQTTLPQKNRKYKTFASPHYKVLLSRHIHFTLA